MHIIFWIGCLALLQQKQKNNLSIPFPPIKTNNTTVQIQLLSDQNTFISYQVSIP